jgi:hypothetical protein
MTWLDEQVPEENAQTVKENPFLKIPDPEAVGKTTEIKLRVLDGEPLGVFRHWLGSRPYNCPGIQNCPVCKVRMDAKKSDPDNYKNEYRMDYRYYFNVLVDHEVKVWSFTSTVGRKLQVFQEKYGDLRNYDISIRKRKTGKLPQNVEYDVIYEKEFALSEKDTVIAEDRYDREPYIKPANSEDLAAVALGVEPSEETNMTNMKASKADITLLKALVEQNNYTLGDFGIVETSPPSKDRVTKLIKELSASKA